MKKEDIEKILLLSYDYFKNILGDYIDIGELKNLSDWIMAEIDEEIDNEKQINRTCAFRGS